jgi:hypothetical protein
MSELAVLAALVAGIYLYQCICWAPERAVVFRTGVLGKGRQARRGFAWNALHISGYWSNPLPIEAMLAVNWPWLSIDADGVETHAEAATKPWEGVSIARAGQHLQVDGAAVLHGPAAQVREFEVLVRRVAGAKRGSRAQLIEKWLRESTDLKAAKERVALFRSQARYLAVLACLELMLLFIATPYLFCRLGTRAIWVAAILIVTTSLAITLEFWMAHRALYGAGGDARWTSALTILLSPLSAIRAMDALGRDLLAGFHPVTAAAALCSAEEFGLFAGEQLRQLSYGLDAGGWYAERTKECVMRVVKQAGLSAEKLLAPPAREDQCAFYCPRCLAQYLAARANCADCGYEGLVRF